MKKITFILLSVASVSILYAKNLNLGPTVLTEDERLKYDKIVKNRNKNIGVCINGFKAIVVSPAVHKTITIPPVYKMIKETILMNPKDVNNGKKPRHVVVIKKVLVKPKQNKEVVVPQTIKLVKCQNSNISDSDF